jgi:hypothetical protein
MKKWKNILIFLVWMWFLYYVCAGTVTVPVNWKIDTIETINNKIFIESWKAIAIRCFIVIVIAITINSIYKRLSNH